MGNNSWRLDGPCGRSVHCAIVPPHIIEALARNGSEEERNAALDTLSIDTSLRNARLILGISEAAQVEPVAVGSTRENRIIYDAQNNSNLPGIKRRGEGEPPTADVAVNEAYDGLGGTWSLYWNVYNRNSIDNNGMDLIGTIHYGTSYDNAFFNGSQMVFGDGDGVIFNRFTISIEIMGHELTHGVTAATANLAYQGQSGALNESISDVFGSLVKQYNAVPQLTAAQADWLIGAGLFAAGVNGVALRSMKAPGTAYNDSRLGGKDPQPDNMSGYVNTMSDNGGVHLNSGIPNRAFYLVAMALGGYAWEKAGHIWYITLLDSRLSTTASFVEFAKLTADNAVRLYGQAEQDAVIAAWATVGIRLQFSPVYAQGDPGSGIGGYDLRSPADRVFAFDYDGSGKLDHLALYRPGTGTIWILK
jgi:Zn-dependent metalloprotease